jgi:hypothetical protein
MHRLAVNLELVLPYRGDEAFVQAVLAQVTWHHNLAILERFAAADDRIWYAKARPFNMDGAASCSFIRSKPAGGTHHAFQAVQT